MPKHGSNKSAQATRSLLRFHRHFRKTLKAFDQLHALGALDSERYRHLRLVLEHSQARVGLDVAEWAQQFELARCSQADRRLRRLEAKNTQ